MKNTITFLLLSTLTLFAKESLSQTYQLELTNMSNGKTRVVSTAKQIKVETIDGKQFIGPMAVINDSTILVDDLLIRLADIQSIKLKHVGTRIAGSVLSGVGLTFTGIGLFAFAADAVDNTDDLDGCGMIVGGITAGCGLLLFLPGQLIRGSRISYSNKNYIYSISEKTEVKSIEN